MMIKQFVLILLVTTWFFALAANKAETGMRVPENLFNIGNSIGEGEAADDVIGVTNHDVVWSTGYSPDDGVYSLNERFEDVCPADFEENDAVRDATFNLAVSGSDMGDFADQAGQIVLAAATTESGRAGMISVFLGNNDVCASSLEDMTPPELFEREYRAGLGVLASSDATRKAHIQVVGVPAIYWLWEVMRNNTWCLLVWNFVPCENLLSEPDNDCGSNDSHLDPDTIHVDDGPNCIRRKTFHARIRDFYNPLLRDVLQEYIDDGRLANAYYVDIFDIIFSSTHVNDGDCFHPSLDGHALLADVVWARSPWGLDGAACLPGQAMPWMLPLLLDGRVR
jgi:lysophospholipase L1-like esterase